MSEALLGLTALEAANTLSLSQVVLGRYDTDFISRHKAEPLKNSGTLEIVDAEETVESVGGLMLLKDWLTTKKASLTQTARDFGIPPAGAPC